MSALSDVFSEGPHKKGLQKNLEGFLVFADLLKTGGVATEGGFTVQIIPSYLLDVIRHHSPSGNFCENTIFQYGDHRPQSPQPTAIIL